MKKRERTKVIAQPPHKIHIVDIYMNNVSFAFHRQVYQ